MALVDTTESLKARDRQLTTRNVQRGVPRVNNFRAFTLAAHVLRYLIRNELTTVELAAISQTKYDSTQRIVAVAREAGLIKPCGLGTSSRGTKPTKYTIDLDQGLAPMGSMTIIDQATLHIRNGTDFVEAIRKGFLERFGLVLLVDPGFVDAYTYKTSLGSLSPPQEMWIEGFTRGWALYPTALLEWQKRQVAERRDRKDSERKRGIFV